MTRIAAVQAANEALNELGLDQAAPIDPFEAIESMGLRLSFKPLKDLLGAILPGEPGGVLINSARPASMQRYTAGHELGHWYLNHGVVRLDTNDAVFGGHNEALELDAQVFAAHFLMPLELLHSTARRYGIRRGLTVQPEQAYQAARDMHVSYEAAVRQLLDTRLITPANRKQLLDTQPATIKQRLTDGMPLPNARGDVWILDHPDDQVEIEAFVGDAILLRLSENPATGYRWCAQSALPQASVHQLRPAPAPFTGGHAFANVPPTRGGDVIPFPTTSMPSEVVTLFRDAVLDEPYQAGATAIGGAVTRLVTYTAVAPGEESINLSQVRPVRPDAPVSRLEVTTLVRGVPEVEFRRRLLAAFAREETDFDDWDR